MISTVWRYTQPLPPRAYIVWSQPCKLIWAESFLHPCGAPQPSKAGRASCSVFQYGKWPASSGCREHLPYDPFHSHPLAVELYPNLGKSNISWNFGPLFTSLQLKKCAPSRESKEALYQATAFHLSGRSPSVRQFLRQALPLEKQNIDKPIRDKKIFCPRGKAEGPLQPSNE